MLKRMNIDVPEPDYAQSVEDVYTIATVVAIQADGKLSVLLHRNIRSDLGPLPLMTVPGELDHGRNPLLRLRIH